MSQTEESEMIAVVVSSLLSKNVNLKMYKTVILSVVLYGCGSWFVTFREKLNVLCNGDSFRSASVKGK